MRKRLPLCLTVISLLCVDSSIAAEPELVVERVFIKLLDEVRAPARQTGLLSNLLVRVGQSVERGELLAQVDDSQAQLTLERAQVELTQVRLRAANDLKVRLAEKSLEVARVELRRSVDSYERFPKSVSQSELDRLQLAVQRAELELEQARFELEDLRLAVETSLTEVAAAENALSQHRVEAPFSGLVVERIQRQGEWVRAGDAVLRLVRIDRLRAEGVVDATLADGDLAGRPVRITVRLGEEEIQTSGRVVFVSPEVEPVSRQVKLWAEIENPRQRLRPGLQAEMTVER